jgi:transposase
VKQERLEFLSSNTSYTNRLALAVGALCRTMTIQDVARRMNLDWHTVKEMEKQYMAEQLRRAGPPSPAVIGVDEISVRKYKYKIIVSDLEKGIPIWFGGNDRKEASMDQFFDFLGEKKCQKIRLAVMDMWQPFRNSTNTRAPNAAILYDKFHIICHLNQALDDVRRKEFFRIKSKELQFMRGQKFILLSRKENLSTEKKGKLKLLLQANKRLNTAYLLKESFDQLWMYDSEVWARKFFDNWKAQLRWQRIKHFEKFAELVEKNWHGIISHCKPENKVPLGFVEGMNNKIRVIQKRSYGLRDEEYLRLKILTCKLPEL